MVESDREILICPRVNIKELTSVFSRPFSEPVAIRPKSWSPNERTARMLLGDAKNNNDDQDSDFGSVERRCFGDLTRNCGVQAENHHHDEFGRVNENGMSTSPNNDRSEFIEARNNHLFLAPPQQQQQELHPHPLPVNTSLYNPNCRCDMELELRVPDDPVLIDESVPSEETEAVVQSMSNLPLRVRNSEDEGSGMSKMASKDEPLQEEGGRAEELSVKTLANMYDFKKSSATPSATAPPPSGTSGATRPCSVARLEDSRLFQKAKKLTSIEAEVGDKRSAQKQSDC